VDAIVAAWKEAYGKERVEEWIEMFAQKEDTQIGDFDKEDIWDG
jgi:hypothetical protein